MFDNLWSSTKALERETHNGWKNVFKTFKKQQTYRGFYCLIEWKSSLLPHASRVAMVMISVMSVCLSVCLCTEGGSFAGTQPQASPLYRVHQKKMFKLVWLGPHCSEATLPDMFKLCSLYCREGGRPVAIRLKGLLVLFRDHSSKVTVTNKGLVLFIRYQWNES